MRHSLDGELVGPHALFDLLPGDRGRDRGARPRTRAIGADRGCAAAVAQIINVNAAPPRPLGHIRREVLRALRDEAVGNPFCERLDFVPAELGRQRDDHMQPLAAGRLRKAFETDPGQCLTHIDSGLGHPLPPQPLVGVEIHGDPVGGLQLLDPRPPGMDLEHAHLHQRDESG